MCGCVFLEFIYIFLYTIKVKVECTLVPPNCEVFYSMGLFNYYKVSHKNSAYFRISSHTILKLNCEKKKENNYPTIKLSNMALNLRKFLLNMSYDSLTEFRYRFYVVFPEHVIVYIVTS